MKENNKLNKKIYWVIEKTTQSIFITFITLISYLTFGYWFLQYFLTRLNVYVLFMIWNIFLTMFLSYEYHKFFIDLEKKRKI